MSYLTLTQNISDVYLSRGYGYGYSSYGMGSITEGWTITGIDIDGGFVFETVELSEGAPFTGPTIVFGIQTGAHPYSPVNAYSDPDVANWMTHSLTPTSTGPTVAITTYASDSAVAYTVALNGVRIRWRGQMKLSSEQDFFFSSANTVGETGPTFTWAGLSRIYYS